MSRTVARSQTSGREISTLYANGLECCRCRRRYPLTALDSCPECVRPEISALNHTLTVTYDLPAVRRALDRDELSQRPAGLWRNWELMPVRRSDLRLEVAHVGNTPLTEIRRTAEAAGVGRVWAKQEGTNPTASFKDRPVHTSLAKAMSEGAREFAVFTSGNVGAALAAACARGGLRSHVFLMAGAAREAEGGSLSQSKLAQIIAYGAEVLTGRGSLTEMHRLASRLETEFGWTFLNRYQAYEAEGDKTIAFEICAQLNWQVPEAVVVPVGTGANLHGIYTGFEQYRSLGFIDRVPRMVAVQPQGAHSLAAAIAAGSAVPTVLPPPPEDIPAPLSHRVCGQVAVDAVQQSGGDAVAVSVAEVKHAQRELATREGFLVESASATAIAGITAAVRAGVLDEHSTVVAILTGHGLKDLSPPLEQPPVMPMEWQAFRDAYGRLH